MALNKTLLLNGLLRKNYFPFQKKKKEELPPIFSTVNLTVDIAEKIRNISLNKIRLRDGFDSIQYKTTRFNNVPRMLSIPHPKPYVDLCFEIYDNWDNIKHICTNQNSLIKPRSYKDGRVLIMDYEKSEIKRNRYFKEAFGKKFIANTDISNCFPSLYSHSIPWALVGVKISKTNRNPIEWYNKLDKAARLCSKNETAGVPIGPATSNILCEIILAKIDHELSKKFNYIRFIDDYTVYCRDHTQAEEFIRKLSIELMQYKLNLNIKKTQIKSLPQPFDDEWIGRLKELLPTTKHITSSKVSQIFDAAVRLQKNNPDGSILKYAANSIIRKLDDKSSVEFVKYVLKLSYYYPVLIPSLHKPLNNVSLNKSFIFKTEINFLLRESIENNRSDAACWLLYYAKIYNIQISTKVANSIIKWGDCLSLTLLFEFPKHQQKVIDFTLSLNTNDPYEIDSYWLLLYQLYLKDAIKNISKDPAFDILKKNTVSFLN